MSDETTAHVLRFPTPKLAPISLKGTLFDPEVQQQVARDLGAAAERANRSMQEMARQMSAAMAERGRQP